MAALTSRERVRRALNHEEPDRIPVDVGGSSVSTLTAGAAERLERFLGIRSASASLDRRMSTTKVSPEMAGRLGVDLVTVSLKPPSRSQERFNADGTWVNEWGMILRRADGGFWDIVRFPLAEATAADLEGYPWPDPLDAGRLYGLADEVRALHEETSYALVANFGSGQVFEMAWNLRGFDRFLMDLVVDKPFAHALLQRLIDEHKLRIGAFLEAVGRYVAIIRVSDDLAGQLSLLMSPPLYREMIKPYHAEYFRFIKERTDAKLALHCCGAVAELIPDLIEVGVDVLNPIQTSAAGMADTAALKERFGNRLSFWGAIDVQKVLPLVSPDEVRAEVRRQVHNLAPGGGFILSPAHNVQPDVPPENVMAMVEEAHACGCYPIQPRARSTARRHSA